MASKTSTALALFLAINLIIFNMSAATTYPTCSKDSLQISACANVLNLVSLTIGSSSYQQCCSLINGLADLEAAVCLCSSLKLSVLGITVDTNAQISLILNACRGSSLPSGFQCPA
ncbi:PREDICTED: putative lipid-binding protein AIR1B [Tarenaya hassleriana]|uniref:putative lipid-binding protein AIR1B n=1 Tax=Tarenaya hassleriana TaxID=28532 RepID=UPI00053C61CE|nr:PREDICTED: putative lipid-binding protein AIR1B [Tarenaya hassleriana]